MKEMDAERANSIDFADSKFDSYSTTSEDVMKELNAYFKSYIANADGKKEGNIQDTLDGIFNGSSFDDAIEAIHREHSSESSEDDDDKESDKEDKEDTLNDDTFDGDVEQKVLDVEILDQHIDKHGLNGGSDATRAIENMAGGNINADGEELDDHDSPKETDKEIPVNEFANNMLGIQGGGVSINGPGLMKGYSGVTNEIRVKGNRVTERDRSTVNYRSEDGRLDMGMLGGSFEENDDWEDPVTDTDIGPYPEREGDKNTSDDEPENDAFINGPTNNEEYEEDSDDYSESSSDEEIDDESSSEVTTEIDLVLNQLRNKVSRTLTGGAVNIRKKVVLTDMYPYIVRS